MQTAPVICLVNYEQFLQGWLLCRNLTFYRSFTQQKQQLIFSLIGPTKHMTLRIQDVNIKALHAHCLALITPTISPALIFTVAVCLSVLILCPLPCTSKPMTSKMRPSLQAMNALSSTHR